jgi:hypothetical protein
MFVHVQAAVFLASPDMGLSDIHPVLTAPADMLPDLCFHGADKTSDHLLHMEGVIGLSSEHAKSRLADQCADGAFFGIGSPNTIGRISNEKQGISQGSCRQGQLCSWHGTVKVAEHSDREEQDPKDGLLASCLVGWGGFKGFYCYPCSFGCPDVSQMPPGWLSDASQIPPSSPPYQGGVEDALEPILPFLR